jgi:hypothetical protein
VNAPRDGSPDHPYSALNLRLAFALFGIVALAAIGALAWGYGYEGAAVACLVLAIVAVVNAIVVQRRRMARRRAEGDGHHTLFE